MMAMMMMMSVVGLNPVQPCFEYFNLPGEYEMHQNKMQVMYTSNMYIITIE